MGENLNPLDELKNLDQQVDRVAVLEDLKPIFFRLDEIAKANANDFEVQLVVGDVKQHLVNRGTKLKEQAARAAAPPAVKPAPGPGANPPPLPPPMPAAMPPRVAAPAAPPAALSNVPNVPNLPKGPASPDAPTVILTPRPPVTPIAPPAAGTTPPVGATAPGARPRSPLEGPAPLSELRSPAELNPPGQLKPPGEVKPPVRLMSSGQFSSPAKPPDVTPPAPPMPPTLPPRAAEPPAPRSVRPPQSAPPPPFPGPGGPPAIPASSIPASSIPAPVISKPPSAEPPGSPETLTLPMAAFGRSAGPTSTGPQTPPAGPPGQPPQPPSQTSSRQTSRPAPQGASAAKPPAKQSMNWKRALLVGAMLGAVAAVVGIAFLVNLSRKHNKLFEQKQAAEMAAVQVQISTTPPNASVRVNGETKCTAPCAVALTPGSYQVTAFLDGYDPATSALSVVAGQPGTVAFTLTPQPQTVRILTDLDQGKIAFDDQPPADLQEGQFILDNVAPGSHTVKVTAKSGDATFTFDIAEAKPPAVTGTIAARNLIAVLVSSFANQARIVTNSGPLKLAVNGQPEGDAGPEGVDLKAFQPGVDELVVGDGKDQRNMKESFGPGPMLTAFVKSDLNIGTLIVSTGEDDVRVYLNDKEYQRRTARGQLRIPAIGKVKVAVYKDGFQIEPAQNTEVKKGAEVRLEFKLRALPSMTTLQIRGGTPGAEVWIDQTNVGTVGPDGSFTYPSVAPGDHAIELRRDQYTTKRIQRTFRTGQPVSLSGADVTLVASAPTNATIRVARTPANATVTYRRTDETEAHELRAPQVELPAGSYIFSAKAPGYNDRTDRVNAVAGVPGNIDMALTPARPTAPAVKSGDVTDFEEAGAWKKEGDLFVHKGGGFVPYKLGPRGTYTFTVELLKGGGVFRGGRIRWAVQYIDAKNYLSYEMDRKTFWAYVVEKGKRLERQKTPLQLDNGKTFTIQIEITPDHCVHKLKTGDAAWLTLDSFAEPGRNFTAGKFGFVIQGNDEIGISDFTFSPK